MLVDDEVFGFDIDMALFIAERLGYGADEIEWVQAPTMLREQLIEEDFVDFVVGNIAIPDHGSETMDFAGPFIHAPSDLLVRAGSDITEIASLEGKLVCAPTGSPALDHIVEADVGAIIVDAITFAGCYDALVSGTIDAVAGEDYVLAGIEKAFPGRLELVGHTYSFASHGIAFPQGSELCTQASSALAEWIESGAWEDSVAANLADYNIHPTHNPPQLAPCGQK
jgi:glutamate transport system substrate-binding protein